MIIRYKKASHADSSHTFTAIREDGSATGMASTDFFIRHDLSHYAVETVLGLQQAFLGLLSQGWDINDFEARQPGSRKARILPAETYYAEVLVGAFDLELALGEQNASFFSDRLEEAIGPGAKPLTEAQLTGIRELQRTLLVKWAALGDGDALELRF